jgi:hypothetical protein
MRRRVASGPTSGRPEPALDHGGHGALSVRAGHDNKAAGQVRASERREQRTDLVESELDAELFEGEQVFA